MSALSLLGILFVCLALGVPVAIALGLASIVTIMLFSDQTLAVLAQRFFSAMQVYPLLAVPFFISAIRCTSPCSSSELGAGSGTKRRLPSPARR